MNNDALAKITMLNSSLRCFAYGLLGLLPGIGIPFAVMALWMAGRVSVREKLYWNAARAYRIWGTALAVIGFSLWGGITIIIMINAYFSS